MTKLIYTPILLNVLVTSISFADISISLISDVDSQPSLQNETKGTETAIPLKVPLKTPLQTPIKSAIKPTIINNSSDADKKISHSSYNPSYNSNYNRHTKNIVTPEKNEKLIQGYRTTTDKKGRQKTEYVYGVVSEGKDKLHTGYLYGEKNQPIFVYGDVSTGNLQEYNNGSINIDSESINSRNIDSNK